MVNLQSFHSKRLLYVGQDTIAESLKSYLIQYASIENCITIPLEELDNLYREGDIIIKSPLIPSKKMSHVYTTPARIFFDCAFQEKSIIVGVTGTRGKTTVTSLIHAILQNNNTGNILINDVSDPMFAHAHEMKENTIVVMELSSMDLAELEVSPHIAIVTNLEKDHIDYHGSIDAYWEAKHNIMRYMDESGKVVFNPQVEMVYHWLADSKAEQHPIDPNEVVDMTKSQLFGEHGKTNYLLARTATNLLGVEKFVAVSTLNIFEPVRHRLQIVRNYNGVVYVDNAIAKKPETAISDIEACVRNLKPVGSIMLGGADDEQDYNGLVKMISTLRIPAVVLFPESGKKIRELFPETYTPEILETESMDEAVTWASEKTPSGSVCLLSTASLSEPLWKNYQDKGNQFQNAVQKL